MQPIRQIPRLASPSPLCCVCGSPQRHACRSPPLPARYAPATPVPARHRCLQQPAVRSSAGRSSPQRRTSSSTQFRAYPSRSAALTPACRAPPSASRTQHSAAAVRSSRPAAARSAGPASARKRRAGHSPLRRAPDPVNSTGASRGLQRTAAIMPAEASSAAVLHAAARCAALRRACRSPRLQPAAPRLPQPTARPYRRPQRHPCRSAAPEAADATRCAAPGATRLAAPDAAARLALRWL